MIECKKVEGGLNINLKGDPITLITELSFVANAVIERTINPKQAEDFIKNGLPGFVLDSRKKILEGGATVISADLSKLKGNSEGEA